MNTLLSNAALFVPLIVLELILIAAALIHILRHDTYKTGNRIIWIILAVSVQFIGPILYFIVGREDE